jgi:rod shape-determining protein MreC
MNLARSNRRILITVAIGFLLVVGGVAGALGPLRWVFDLTILPVGRGLASAGSATSQTLGNLSKVSDLARANDSLSRENASLRQRLAADGETRRDNDALRRELGLQVAGSLKQQAAEVVAYEPGSYRQFVTINQGSSLGIKDGMAVMSGGVLIGEIRGVQAGVSRVILVSDPEFKLTAKDQDTQADGLVQGQLGSGLSMTQIGQTAIVHPGDTVTTTGLGGQIPAGLLIGKIESVNAPTNAVFQSAEVSTTLQTSQLRFVMVVLGS